MRFLRWAVFVVLAMVVPPNLPAYSFGAEPPPKAQAVEDGGFYDRLPLQPEERKKLAELWEAERFASGLDSLGGGGYGKKKRSILAALPKDLERSSRMCRILATVRYSDHGDRGGETDDPAARRVPIETVEAIRFLARSRDPQAVEVLLPDLGVVFYAWTGGDDARMVGGRLADDALVSIGLPAADRILCVVGEGKMGDSQAVAARNVALRILGPESLRGRATDLKLSDNERVQRFLRALDD
jgi:hypothetical protein